MIPFAPDLTFLAPERFALLLVPLLFAVLYLARQRRRQAYVVRFTDPDLIETVAQPISDVCLADDRVDWARVTVHKPGAIRHSRDVGVVVERGADA